MPERSTVASPEALAALRMRLKVFPPSTRQKGRDYYESGKVGPLKPEEGIVSAKVVGSSGYSTSLIWDGKSWKTNCSCPMTFGCKHCYALALAWLDQQSAPATVPVTAPTPADPKPKIKKVSFREQWAPVLAAKLGRPLKSEEAALLGGLSALFKQLVFYHSAVYGRQLADAGFRLPEALRRPDAPLIQGWWETPPADPWALWQFIALAYERAGQPIPPAFAPMTDVSPIRAKVDAVLHQRAVGSWLEALRTDSVSSGSHNPKRSATPDDAMPVHAIRLMVGGPTGWTLQIQTVADGPFKNLTQRGRSPAEDWPLARFTHLPPEQFTMIALLRECTSPYSYSTGFSLLDAIEQVLSHPQSRRCVVNPGGQPISCSDRPLLWKLSPDPAHPDCARFHLVLPDGSPADEALLVSSGSSPLYLVGETVFPGPPILPQPEAQIPIAVVRDPKVTRALLARGVQFSESFEIRVRQAPMRARLECWLSQNAANNCFPWPETLLVCLTAHSDDPPYSEVWTIRGWKPNGTPALADSPTSDGAILQFDRTIGDAAAATFASFGFQTWPMVGAWIRGVNRAFPEEFLAWRERLPPKLEVLATGELALLLGAPIRARLCFAIEEADTHRDWFDLSISLRPEQIELSDEEMDLLLRAHGKFVRLPRRGWRRLEVASAGPAEEALGRLGLSPESVLAKGTTDRHRLHALQLAGEADTLLPADAAAQLRARAAALETSPVPLPAGLMTELRPYQQEGFQFLTLLSRNSFGGVLADDMGLGKTVEALAWLLWLRERDRTVSAITAPASSPWRVLVVCPKSVTDNWRRETARFTPSLTAAVFAGGDCALPAADIIICNYAQLRLGRDRLLPVDWAAVVLDEGQNIKNPRAQTAQVARNLRAAHRLVLTGTPIENRALDLWSLFSFAQPGWLGSEAAFKKTYDEKAGPGGRARLARRVRHFLLRRTKAQVAADLPARIEEDLSVELEGEQLRLYEAELKRARLILSGLKDEEDFRHQRFNILASLLRLRQICCHPALLDPAYREFSSAKLDALMDTIEPLIEEGHKVLVFSQFVELLKLVAVQLVASGISHLMLTGQTEDRGTLVDRFQSAEGPPVFLLSLRAAGTGLNLTAASYVVLFDPWWNPAVEAQAIDRTHRIGQTSQVIAYRLLAKDTVEEKIRRLQQDKAALARAIVEEDNVAQVMDLASLRLVLGENAQS